MGSRHIKDINEKTYFPNTGGYQAQNNADMKAFEAIADAARRRVKRVKNDASATGLKRKALLIALDMRGDPNDPESSFMLQGEIFDDKKTLETIDDQYGTTFVYGLKQLEKEWADLSKKAEEFAASLSSFADNELE